MKLVHLCLGDKFVDHYSYQVNMLVKYHKKMGFETEVIASCDGFDEAGNVIHTLSARTYYGEENIKITRIPYKRDCRAYYKLKKYIGLKDALEEAEPDILFIHNCQFLDIEVVVTYLKKHPEVRVYVDNHADFSNSAKNFVSMKILHGIIWKHCAHRIEPFAKAFYGVLPARVDFLKNVYGLPEAKCKLLVMGADDDAVQATNSPEVKQSIRRQYGIADEDFLIMTGGKIDAFKTQTLLLMQAVQNIPDNNVKLIVFGSVTSELKEKVQALADGVKVQYIGWIKAEESYRYFAAADLVVFPGRHSVFWEQVAAQGIPMLVKDWPGTHHVDLGGNVRFLTKDSAEEIQEEIERLIHRPEEYRSMKRIAEDRGMEVFSYAEIAKRAIEM